MLSFEIPGWTRAGASKDACWERETRLFMMTVMAFDGPATDPRTGMFCFLLQLQGEEGIEVGREKGEPRRWFDHPHTAADAAEDTAKQVCRDELRVLG